MRLVEMIGHALRPVRSEESKMISAESPDLASNPDIKQIEVQSPAFADGGNIPKEFTMDGHDLFPGLSWKNLPNGTASVLIVVEDPDIPKTTPFVHGIIYNVPARVTSLPANAFRAGEPTTEYATKGIKCGGNTLGQAKYMSPSPPPGHGPHHYFFQVFALDTPLRFDWKPRMPDIKEAITGHVIGYGETVGVYERGH